MPLLSEELAAVFQPESKAVRVLVDPALFVEVFILFQPDGRVGAVLLAVTKAVTSSKSPACSPVQAAVLVAAALLEQMKLRLEARALGIWALKIKTPGPYKKIITAKASANNQDEKPLKIFLNSHNLF